MGLTTGGLLFCCGTVLIAFAAIDANLNLLVLVFGMCLGAILVDAISGWRTLRAVSVVRVAPDFSFARQPMEIRYHVTNPRPWKSARGIHLIDEAGAQWMADPEAYVAKVGPGETLTITVPAVALRRGRIAFDIIRLRMRFPFGIFSKTVTHHADHEITVFPALGRLSADVVSTLSKSINAIEGGLSLARARGDEEYYGVREYRLGDNPRRIHWRRSAQTGQLMIREMAKARDPQLWCFLDTRSDAHSPGQSDDLETAISAAATVICDMLERGVRVGLICNGDPPVILPPGAGRPRRRRLLRELAIRGHNPDDFLADVIQRLSWPARWRGSCLLFAARETDELRATSRLLARNVGPTAICVPGNESFGELFGSQWLAEQQGAEPPSHSGVAAPSAPTVGASK